MDPVRPFKAIDLFAGCGGLTQGLVDAGFQIVAAVELSNLAAHTYELNHPSVPMLNEDIRDVSIERLLGFAGLEHGELDLLAGCPPCQGFSRIRCNNKQTRVDDERNRLIDEVLRIVEGIAPKVLMLENVPNLRSYTRHKLFKRALRKMGYRICERVVDVADYGIPQRRKRLVVLASRLSEIYHCQPNYQRKTVREAIGWLDDAFSAIDPAHNIQEKRCDRIKDLISAIPKDGGSRKSLPATLSLACHSKQDGFYDVYGRMRWDDVAPTITGGCVNPSKGRFIHPEQNRAITLREAALLQSFPRSYKFCLRKGKYAAAEMIGNALPPAFSKFQGSAIATHLKNSDSSRSLK